MNLNRFDLASLRLFVQTVEGGSLTAGAEQFGISLAAASKRIAELEARVGQPLLTRSKRGVAPTPAGQTLLRHSIELVTRLEQLAVAMDDFQHGVEGHLRLWANPSSFNGFLPGVLAAYSAAHPAVRLDLEDAFSEDAVRAVASGAAELAVIGANTPTGRLQTMVCDSDQLVLVLPTAHPLVAAYHGRRATPQPVPLLHALEYDFVALGRATSLTRQIAAAAESAGGTLRIRVQVRSFDALCRMVAAGLGIAILPQAGAVVPAAALGLRLLPIAGMETARQLLLAMRDLETLSAPARSFTLMVQRRVAESGTIRERFSHQ